MDRILKASYGDQGQREANAKAKVPRAQAAQVEAAYRERRAANPRAELPTPPSGNGPLFWDAKHQGTPYGLFNANRQPPQPRREVKVEIRPGIFHVVQQAAAGAAGAGAAAGAAGAGVGGAAAGAGAGAGAAPRRGRPSSAPPRTRAAAAAAAASPPPPAYQQGQRQGQGQGQQPVSVAAVVGLLPRVAELEERMRGALREVAAVHVTERTVLLAAFGAVLGRRHVELGPADKVTPDQFVAVWRRLGLGLGRELAVAFFEKYGRDAAGRMPVMNFAHALLLGGPRLDMAWGPEGVQRGAYVAGRPATHNGKILYPECKKGVWPPSSWDPRLAERSARLPDARLQLEFVHGYDGQQATSPNIFYTATGQVVYNVAALGVVYDKETHTQRFFTGHSDDVLCVALHPDRTTAATGQLGRRPGVAVWDTRGAAGAGDGSTCKQLAWLPLDRDYRGIQALAFSPDSSPAASRLAAVSCDPSHCLHLWHWPSAAPLCAPRKSQPGAPPAVYGVVWSRFEPDRLVTYGANHIKFWRLHPDPRGPAGPASLAPASEAGVFALGKTHTVVSACFLPSGIVLAGNEAGCICSWRGSRLVRQTQAHGAGPPARRPDGKPCLGGVRCLGLTQGDKVLLSGGADGVVRLWDVSGGDLGPLLRQFPLLRPDQLGTQPPPALRGLDADPRNPEVFVAGVASCDVWEVDSSPRVLVWGQRGDLYGLAPNPAFAHVFATCCDSDQVTVWSAATRKPIRIISLGGLSSRGAAFSPDGQHLAVGTTCGGVQVMEFHPAVRQVWWGKPFRGSVDVLQYSPCGRWLAAGSHDQSIEVFDVSRGYSRVCRCVGASSAVRHLDWAAEGGALQAVDQAYELLYFDPLSGKQLKTNQRDTPWATWTCLLGFPVMGIWFPDSDGTDINAVHASPLSGKYVLTADDRGRVRLLNFPCVVQQAPAREYGGHSSHVMSVRWGADETYAVSVGGKDRAVFQWRVIHTPVPPHPHQQPPMPTPWAQVDEEGLMWAPPRAAGGLQGGQQGGQGQAGKRR